MACESQSKGECRKHAVFHSVHHGEQDFLGALLVAFVLSYKVRCHIVCEVVSVDVDEGAKECNGLGAEITQGVFGATERTLGVDDPVLSKQGSQP